MADQADLQCRLGSPTFAAYSSCIRQAVAGNRYLNTGPNVDLVSRYIAGLGVLEGHITDGKMDGAQALLISSEFYSELKDTYLQRSYADAAIRQRRSEQLGALGLGLMSLGAPRPVGPTPGFNSFNCTSTQTGVFTNTNCQ